MSSLMYSCGLILGLLFVSGNFASSQRRGHSIYCYTCIDDECASLLRKAQICQGVDIKSQTCVTVFGADNSVVRRGCSDDVAVSLGEYCDSHSDKCIKCTSNGCNTAMAIKEFVECISCDSKDRSENFAENRLHCHTCLGENCEDPLSEQCPLDNEEDQCFVRFDDTNTVTAMGCLSDLGGDEVVDLLKTKKVFICEGDNCNALDKLPIQQQCAICDSTVDINCAVGPSNVGTMVTCGQLPYPNCYTKISNAGETQRGCLADLEENEFVQCILSGGDKCSHCIGNGCNRQIFPENRLQCYSCSSDTDPECESLPTIKAPCANLNDSEKCVSALSGNVTERGCSTSLDCDSSDKSKCRHCSLIGCNTLDLVNRIDDGNHGMWQSLPLRCYSCSGEYCQDSLVPALNCSYGDQQDCVTVFDKEGEVIRRGCQFDVEDTDDLYCRQNPERCTSCKSNECNDAWKLTEYVDCIYCNSETDPSCASNPRKSGFPTRKCHKGCMAAAFTAANGTIQVIRTCLNDKEIHAQLLCSVDESGKECSSCIGESCNNFNYPSDRLTCHICQGPDCSTTVAEHCAAYEKDDTCFAKYENGIVDAAGCSSAFERTVIENWKQEGKLYACEGNSCNSPDKLPSPIPCVTCDSSKNVECATNPSAVTETQLCSGPITSCFSNITNRTTHRGCLQSLSLDQQIACQQAGGATLCEVCSGDKCNSAVYPNDRRNCHICDSDTKDKCKAQPEAVSICPTYLPDDKCVVKLTTNPTRLTERGCFSDLQCDAADSAHCNICNTDACNVQQLDNGAYTLIARNRLLTLLLVIVSFIGVHNNRL